MNMLPPTNVAAGERIISPALLKFDRVIFLTITPSTDLCAPGGSSWLMEVDSSTGGATKTSSFDFNNDGKFDNSDLITNGGTTSSASGVGATVGMVKSTTWLDKTGSGSAVKEMSGSTTNIQSLSNKGAPPVPTGTPVPTGVPTPTPSPAGPKGIYWQQIQ
jgi:type IV pilus assembly protein PilY1